MVPISLPRWATSRMFFEGLRTARQWRRKLRSNFLSKRLNLHESGRSKKAELLSSKAARVEL